VIEDVGGEGEDQGKRKGERRKGLRKSTDSFFLSSIFSPFSSLRAIPLSSDSTRFKHTVSLS
jgi:hypothetical protein